MGRAKGVVALWVTCANCDKVFATAPSSPRKCCSNVCRAENTKFKEVFRKCANPSCGKVFKTRDASAKRQKYCDTLCQEEALDVGRNRPWSLEYCPFAAGEIVYDGRDGRSIWMSGGL